MLDGLEKLQSDDWQLILTKEQQAVVDDLLFASDSPTVFLKEMVDRNPDEQVTTADLFAAYVNFCDQRGWVPMTRNHFGRVIPDAVVRIFGVTQRNDIRIPGGTAQRGWKGISLQN